MPVSCSRIGLLLAIEEPNECRIPLHVQPICCLGVLCGIKLQRYAYSLFCLLEPRRAALSFALCILCIESLLASFNEIPAFLCDLVSYALSFLFTFARVTGRSSALT